MIKKIKKYSQWVDENFASLDTTPGMGNVESPTSTETGSGDSWIFLFEPFELLVKSKLKKKRKKHAQKKSTNKKLLVSSYKKIK